MSIEQHGDLVVCSALSCTACELGQDERFEPPVKRHSRFTEGEIASGEHLSRTMGFGYEDSPLMIVGETPRDVDNDKANYGAFGLARTEFLDTIAGEWMPVVRALQVLGLPSEAFYSTSAMKCSVARSEKPAIKHISMCRELHFGIEIETMQPAVIWITGIVGSRMVRDHFKAASVPELGAGEDYVFEAPAIWRYPKIQIIRTHHPAQVTTGRVTYGQIQTSCTTIMGFLKTIL